MVSRGVSICFQVLVNGFVILLESNLTNLNLTPKWLFSNSIRFETKAIGWNMVISDRLWDYFNKINWSCSNFCGLGLHYYQYNCYEYQYNITIILKIKRIQCRPSLLMHETSIMILLLHYYFAYFWMALVIDHDSGLFCNVECTNINNRICKYNLMNKSRDNNKCIFYSTYDAGCGSRCDKKDEKSKTTDVMTGDLNIDYLVVAVDNCNFIMTNGDCVIIYGYFINIYLILVLNINNRIDICCNYEKKIQLISIMIFIIDIVQIDGLTIVIVMIRNNGFNSYYQGT